MQNMDIVAFQLYLIFFRTGEQIPEFLDAPHNVTVQREGTAFLDCPIKTSGDRPVSYPLVSWIFLFVRITYVHAVSDFLTLFPKTDR